MKMISSAATTSTTRPLLLLVLVVSLCASSSHAFSARLPRTTAASSSSLSRSALWASTTTVEPPTKEKQRTKRNNNNNNDDDDDALMAPRRDDDNNNNNDYPDMEYGIDVDVSRELDDPFHILLLGATFEQPKITVPYVTGSLTYVLNMPQSEATEVSQFAQEHDMACLGTWTREECLSLGRQLQVRDIVCRVVPYTEGGQRGWQAKDGNNEQVGEQSSNAESTQSQ